jgi:Ca2+-binding RTX toxin-like protein
MLTNNVTLRTTANGNATFASTLNGGYGLTANLGSGSLNLLGVVSGIVPLAGINIISSGTVTGSDLNLTLAPGTVIHSIAASGSNNTITIQTLSNQTANFVISGTNTGNISTSGGTSIGSFTGITRLVGGAGKDTFKFVNNSALLNGTIDGGSGTNALNYSGTTKSTFINLGTGQATGVTSTTSTGVVTNIQNVFGGTGNDYLVGSADSNVMDGGAGDDTMSGLGGNDIMVGNYGADNMNGGAGIDILIGGYVDFVVGSLQDGLESIMSFWNNVTDGTFNAVSNTIATASSTQPRLVGDTNLASTYLLQTVFNDQATDRLTDISSSTTPNWYFATERVTLGNDVVLAGTTFTVSKKTVSSKTARSAR